MNKACYARKPNWKLLRGRKILLASFLLVMCLIGFHPIVSWAEKHGNTDKFIQSLPRNYSGYFQWNDSNEKDEVFINFKHFNKLSPNAIEVLGEGQYENRDNWDTPNKIKIRGIINPASLEIELWESNPVRVDWIINGSHRGHLSSNFQFISATWTTNTTGDMGHLKLTALNIPRAKEPETRHPTTTPALPTSASPNDVHQKRLPVQTAGTGFSLGSSGYILTNYHVVKEAKLIRVKHLNGDIAKAKVIVKDESNDIVFLKPEHAPKLPGTNISLGDSSEMRIGDKVFTIGFPMSNILGHQPGYSEGVINSLAGVGDDPKTFRISIPIQSGNSGGPLFNQKGEVVGIVSSSLDSANTFQVFGNAPQNVNFAIKSTFVKNLLPMIPDALIAPTGIVVVPKDSGSLSGFIERVQNNIVLIEAEY